jgi:hypothetical protein
VDSYTFRFPMPPAAVVDAFRSYYGPTMNAFAAADKDGRADALREELDLLDRVRERHERLLDVRADLRSAADEPAPAPPLPAPPATAAPATAAPVPDPPLPHPPATAAPATAAPVPNPPVPDPPATAAPVPDPPAAAAPVPAAPAPAGER